MLLKDQVED